MHDQYSTGSSTYFPLLCWGFMNNFTLETFIVNPFQDFNPGLGLKRIQMKFSLIGSVSCSMYFFRIVVGSENMSMCQSENRCLSTSYYSCRKLACQPQMLILDASRL